MPLENIDRETLVTHHLEKAERYLKGAKDTVAIFPEGATRTAYESCYHGCVALFIAEKLNIPNTHGGVISTLNEFYIKSKGLIPKEIGTYLGQLEHNRNKVAYSAMYEMTFENAKTFVEKADKTIQTIRPLVKERLKNLKAENKTSIENEVLDLKLIPGKNNMCVYPTPQDPGEYKGKILHVDREKGYVVQIVGKLSLLVHEIDKLDRIPEKGESVKIQYQNGKISVEKEKKRTNPRDELK